MIIGVEKLKKEIQHLYDAKVMWNCVADGASQSYLDLANTIVNIWNNLPPEYLHTLRPQAERLVAELDKDMEPRGFYRLHEDGRILMDDEDEP